MKNIIVSLREDLRTSVNNVTMAAMVNKVIVYYLVIIVNMFTHSLWLPRLCERTTSVPLCGHFLALFCSYSVTVSQIGPDLYKVKIPNTIYGTPCT